MIFNVLCNDFRLAHIRRPCTEWTVMGAKISSENKLIIFDPAWICEDSGYVFFEMILGNDPVYEECVRIADNNNI